MWYNLVGSSGGRLFPSTSFCPVFPDNCVRNNQDHINPDFYSSKSSHNIKSQISIRSGKLYNQIFVESLFNKVGALETQEIEWNLSIKNDIKHLTHQV